MLTHFGEGEIKGWGLKDFTSLTSQGSLKKPLQAELLPRHGRTTGNIHFGVRAYRSADGPGIRAQDQWLALGLHRKI
jgi:hypothetical protein